MHKKWDRSPHRKTLEFLHKIPYRQHRKNSWFFFCILISWYQIVNVNFWVNIYLSLSLIVYYFNVEFNLILRQLPKLSVHLRYACDIMKQYSHMGSWIRLRHLQFSKKLTTLIKHLFGHNFFIIYANYNN